MKTIQKSGGRRGGSAWLRLALLLLAIAAGSCTCYRSSHYRECEKFQRDQPGCERVPGYACAYVPESGACVSRSPCILGFCIRNNLG